MKERLKREKEENERKKLEEEKGKGSLRERVMFPTTFGFVV